MHSKEMGRPNPKQAAFFRAQNRFVGYGGSRGGGKSWAVRKKATLLALRYPGIRILLLRRSYPELRENHILPLQADLAGVAEYKESEKAFRFPGGSRIKLGYCDNDGDITRYQGSEYDVIFIDEATQIPEGWFVALTACLRGANPFPKRMYITCNPGGVGHSWVKRLFIQRDFRPTENPDDYVFIPARVYDNQALIEQDSGYLAMLENLPESLRRAWLDGDWDIFAGQYFDQWRREIHLVKPFQIPQGWRRYVTMDYGFDMLAVYWIAMDPGGRAYVYREYCQGRDLGEGHRGLLASEAAQAILERTAEPIYAFLAPPDLWGRRQDTGRSIADIFWESGIPLTRAQNDRVAGWMNLKEWLRPYRDETGEETANLRIFESCRVLAESLPALQYDAKNPSDCATTPHEITHAPDAIRYFVAGRPTPGTTAPPQRPRQDYMGQLEELMNHR